jgi:hypothetical protein
MNPINYALGLAAELDGSRRSGDKARETGVREQFAWVAPQLDAVDPAELNSEARALLAEAKTAAADALATKPKRASAAKS